LVVVVVAVELITRGFVKQRRKALRWFYIVRREREREREEKGQWRTK
jgi:hypothetical protein